MIRVAVVEDDARDREEMKGCLRRYEKEHDIKFSIAEFQDGEDIVTDYSADYDIILMDIEMTFLNGMKAAQYIRELDSDVVIIFITNMPQYAIQGYKVNALDYMLKPVSYFSFSETLTRVLTWVKTREKEYITIALKGGRKKMDISRICYVEVQDHMLMYHTTEGKFITKGTMKDAEDQLNPRIFFHCNRCYLVNLEYVEDYLGNDITVNGETIQASRSRRKPFLDALNEYMNEVGK
ncbi:MAG: LytTR family DNA-binding domain-containing protein [Clostridiales bacterium]|nr:LytTR family DNA-binding domain-containing protein [Clostridiales bacterium]